MEKFVSVAIDGPAAAGKSTIAKLVAKKLGYTYIDTGSMYRAFTWYCLNNNIDCKSEKDSVNVIKDVNIELKPGNIVLVNGIDVTKAIREIDVSSNVSFIATYKDIRLAMVKQQQNMAKSTNVVMDGRDIGTYVLPHADVKIFQVASVEERAKRRYKENISKGIACTFEDIYKDVTTRDRIDSSRSFAPLKPAEDSVYLDTSDLTIEEATEAVLKIIHDKLEEKNK